MTQTIPAADLHKLRLGNALTRIFSQPGGGLSGGAPSLWARLDRRIGGQVHGLFRQRGGLYGRPVWPDNKPDLVGTPRMGTDGRQYGVHRSGENPLVASGRYRSSFGIRQTGRDYMLWETDHPLADSMPYREWKDDAGNFQRYVQRYAMPDQNSAAFVGDIEREHVVYVGEVFEQALREAAL